MLVFVEGAVRLLAMLGGGEYNIYILILCKNFFKVLRLDSMFLCSMIRVGLGYGVVGGVRGRPTAMALEAPET